MQQRRAMIEISNLVKYYGDLRAVDNLNLTVPKGELFCFLGPNGAGKTTTIKILTGLLRATSGYAKIGGYDILQDPIEAKKIIGYIPDMPFLYDRLTISEFMDFTATIYNIDKTTAKERTDELFDILGLNEYKSALIKDLSHGLRQRLTYASTLLHLPDILFIDEPLIGLDPRTIRLIKDMLKAKAKSGVTIFLSTHILALAEDIADRIGIILHGRLIELGTLDDLKLKYGKDADLEQMFLKATSDD